MKRSVKKTSKFDQRVTFTKVFIFELGDNQAKWKHCNGIKITFKFLFCDQNVLPCKKINRLIESINIQKYNYSLMIQQGIEAETWDQNSVLKWSYIS